MSYKNLDKILLLSRIQLFCLKNWKLRRAPTAINLNAFLLKFCTRFQHTMSTKGCSGFFIIILFRSWAIFKNLKRSGFYTIPETSSFTFLLMTQDLNKTNFALLKGTLCRFENLPICLRSYKNNTLKISHSYS